MSIAVVYLARCIDGSTKEFIKFSESYNKYNAGFNHDLVIIFKGEAQRMGTKSATKQLFNKRNIISLDVDDNIGFDIHSYLIAAQNLNHDYLCFFNTHSEILGDDWLLKLYEPHIKNNKCGVTGATASYESLYTSYRLMSQVIQMCSINKLNYNELIAAYMHEELTLHTPKWISNNLNANMSNENFQVTMSDLESMQQHWFNVTRPGGSLHGFNLFRPFPNPHLRTNGFLIRRALLNSLDFKVATNKIDCCSFESGQLGLPRLLAEHGLCQILVGKNGMSYEVDNWSKNEGFRIGNQNNVLISDNQVKVFTNASKARKLYLSMLSWGEYISDTPNEIKEVGTCFSKGCLSITKNMRERKKRHADELLKISIVIPTHNRVELLMDALHTIVNQFYVNWECIIFDNKSDLPVEKLVKSLKDPRIKVVRSEKFLAVTESWNTAIDHAEGDYVCLLGDDDGLTPHYMQKIEFMVREHRPDFIYNSLYQFFHPGVAPWEPSGFVSDLRYGSFFQNIDDFFVLDPVQAQNAVKGSLDFNRNFTFNMQSFCFDRKFLDSIRINGKVFHSPFPDYYLANVAFANAAKIVVAPKPISIAGVSKKSFGFTLFNNLETKGAELLATKLEQDPVYQEFNHHILPGPMYNTNYFITMKYVETAIGKEIPTLCNHKKYRRLQILTNILPDPNANTIQELPIDFSNLLNEEEKIFIQNIRFLLQNIEELPFNRSKLKKIHKANQMYADNCIIEKKLDIGSYADLRMLFDAMVQEQI